MFNREIITHLEKWAAKPNRKPLILRGARQVGKTTVVNTLATQFVQYIYLNLENEFDQQLFQESQDIHALVQSIFLAKGQQFARRGETLLFIDEIQQFPAAINMLRYFYEQYSE